MENVQHTLDNGVATATFRGSRKSDDEFLVEVELPEYQIKRRSGLFKIAPGVTGFIYVNSPTDGPNMPAPGAKMHVVVQLKDKFGNIVKPGTTVEWYDYGATGLDLKEDGKPRLIAYETDIEGKAKANFLIAPLYEGNFANNGSDTRPAGFIVQSEGFSKEYIFDFSPIQIQLDFTSPNADGSLDVNTGQSGTLTLTCRHLNGNDVADGTKVSWMTTNGAIQNPQLTLLNGTAQAVLSASGGTRGEAVVKVLIGENSGLGTYGMVSFVSSADASLDVSPKVPLPGDNIGIGIYGPAGGTASVDPIVVDIPAVSYSFKPALVSTVTGQSQPDDLTYHLAALVGSPAKSSEAGTYATDPSMQLHGDGDCLIAPSLPPLQISNGLVLRIWIKPNSFPVSGAAMTLLERHGQYRIILVNDGENRIGFHVIGGTQLITVLSDPLPSAPNFAIEATYIGGLATLIVNGQSSSATGSGLIPLNGAPLVIGAVTNPEYAPVGEYFDGYVDDITVAVRVVIPGVTGILLGSTGYANVSIPRLPVYDQPTNTPAINWNRTVITITISVRVVGPPGSPVDVVVEERCHIAGAPFIDGVKQMIDDFRSLGRRFYDGLMSYVFAEESIDALAELPYLGVQSYKETAYHLANVIVTYAQFLPGTAAWLPLLRRPGMSSYAIARMLRLGIVLQRTALVIEMAQLLEIIYNASHAYLDRLEYLAPSESALFNLKQIQDGYID